jgi:hypothetical protein
VAEDKLIEEAETELAELAAQEQKDKQEQEDREREQKQKEDEETAAKLRADEAAAKLQADEAAAELLQKIKDDARRKLVVATKTQKEKNARLAEQTNLAQQEAERRAAKQASLEASLKKLKVDAQNQRKTEEAEIEQERVDLRNEVLEAQKSAKELAFQEQTSNHMTRVEDVDWTALYPDLVTSAQQLVESQRQCVTSTDDSVIRNTVEDFMRATLQVEDVGPVPEAPLESQFKPDPKESMVMQQKKRQLHQLKEDVDKRDHIRALQSHAKRVRLEQKLFESKREAAVKSVLDTRPIVNGWLQGLEKDYVAPMVQVVRDTHILKEVLIRMNTRFSNLKESYFKELAPLQEAFQNQLRESPFSSQQFKIISKLMGIIPDEVVYLNGVFETLEPQIRDEVQELTEREPSPSHSDFSTGNPPERKDQENVEQNQQFLFETPGKQEPKNMGSRAPGFTIPKIDRSKQPSAPKSSPPTQNPRDNKLDEKYPSATQGYFTGQGNQEDRSLKRQRDPATDWESQPSSSQRNTGGKGGKDKGRGPRGKGKGSTGRGKGNGHTAHNNTRPRSDTWNEKRLDNSPIPPQVALAVLGPEAKDQTPCPQGHRCLEVFTCGFKHVTQDYQATFARSKAEAQVEQERAVRKVADSRGLAEASRPLAHILANQYPNPVWDYPAPPGFHNRAAPKMSSFGSINNYTTKNNQTL